MKYACPLCDGVADNPRDLDTHVRIHPGAEGACLDCGEVMQVGKLAGHRNACRAAAKVRQRERNELASRRATDRPAPPTATPNPWWFDEGSCRGQSHLFFAAAGESSDQKHDRERAARTVCLACPHTLRCRDHARTHHELGIWGGETDEERRRVLRLSNA